MARPKNRSCLAPAFLVAVAIAAISTPAVASAIRKPGNPVVARAELRSATPFDAKTDPFLRLALARWNAAQAAGAGARRAGLLRALTAPGPLPHLYLEEGSDEPVASTFVKLTDPAAAAALAATGARVTTVIEDIAVARVPISRLHSIVALPQVRSVELSAERYAILDSSRVRSHVTEVQAGTGLSQPYLGNGVVVGVLDSGLDYTHPDFRVSATQTRLKGLFDFSNGPNGREWSVGSLDSLTSTEYDGHGSEGHGTHVTGTAAGGGRGNVKYLGMAPAADLMFVKGTRDTASVVGFGDADVVSGVQWIFDKARALGEPAVVNLSLGGQIGAHDGTSLYEQALDALTHPGNIIVAAAGNDGSSFIHGGFTTISGTGYVDAQETLCGVFPGNTSMLVDIWYPANTNISFGVAAYPLADLSNASALGSGALAISPVASLGGGFNSTIITDGSNNYGAVAIDATTMNDANNGKRRVLIQISDGGGALASNSLWSVYAFGAGPFDMWVVAGGQFVPTLTGQPGWFFPGDNDKSVGSPGTARKLISVGSYVTRTQWVDQNGVTRTQPGATLGAVSGFSSHGPTGDGRTKPDLVAPGEAIVAPLAASAASSVPSTSIVQGGGYQKLQGTSMASPHVTGVVALMLQRNRYLTPENARAILQQAAAPPLLANANLWGAGKLDALAAMQATPVSLTCSGPVPRDAAAPADCPDKSPLRPGMLLARPNPTASAATLAFRLALPERVELAVYDLNGRRVRRLQSGVMGGGPQERIWDGTDDRGGQAPSGVYFVRLWTPSQTALQRIVRSR